MENGRPISQQKIVINEQVNGITLMFAKYECGMPAHMNIAVCNWSLRHKEGAERDGYR